jgi:phosphohistidine swiveling domain-containing protein
MALMFIVYIAVRCHLQPHLAPTVSDEELNMPLADKLRLLRAGLIPFLIFFFMTGLFLMGITSLVESSAVGAAAATAAALWKRRLTRAVLHGAVRNTLLVSCMFLWIILAALAFGAIFDGIGAVRAKVPEAHQEDFDGLLEEARLTYPIRDERGVFSDIWASGLMRRAALAAGRRVAERGRIHEAVHLLEAGLEEMVDLLLGRGCPGADDLAARAAFRAAHTVREVPATLGTPPPPPDLAALPPDAARLMRATGIALGALFGSSDAPQEQHRLRGLAASPGIYEGPARRITHSTEFDRIQRGDILVTASTTEAFNILLPLLGAIVTDSGGLLSHSAIVAREYGIPGVVGTRQATAVIADGQRLRVDGTAGTVTVIG